MANQRNLKAFVRYDGSGRVVAGSLVLRRKKPKVGNWKEVPAYEGSSSTPIAQSTALIFSFDRLDICIGMGEEQTIYHEGDFEVGTLLYIDEDLTQVWSSISWAGMPQSEFYIKRSVDADTNNHVYRIMDGIVESLDYCM